MKKVKYFYNTHTLRYEKLEVPLRVKLLRIFAFFATALVTAALIVWFGFRYIGSPNERILRTQLEDYRVAYSFLDKRLALLQQRMNELESRDNQVYRAIFEASPIPDSARAKEIEKDKENLLIQRLNDNQLVTGLAAQLSNLENRATVQDKSYREITEMIRNKERLLAAIPAIQPVSNKNLNRIASGYGNRIDPVYKVTKFHAGLDFTAPQGTPIYATADGKVKLAGTNDGGYGNHVIIDHGFGYETLYGHMVRIKARAGKSVKRGEVIGWVGNTGKSTGPHCHYEVHKNGNPVNPVYFFYNDLNAEQFDRLLKLATASNQSFD
ncbi:M23 family peptidase [Segetibacter sp. 3557_3]|uniref:M23 family metallopeptidase n=1 Tax=Segetibacter sp. 3557_3 TaxID=2547429 RepID=UPI0010585044|nr:M23 family metallopeptidase [Segetibacter sp. 3557_3]TDH24090.1 M23 family peptidase [Segetibacter sp. 3557_3]